MKHTRINHDETYFDGVLVESIPVQVDVTVDAVRVDAHTRLRNMLDRNREYLDLPAPTAAQRNAQIDRNARATNLIIRLLLALDDTNARDLIDDDPGRE